MAIIHRIDKTKCWWGYGEMGVFVRVGTHDGKSLWKIVRHFLPQVKFTIWPLLGICSRELKTYVHTKTWMYMFIAVLIHNSQKLEAIQMSIIRFTDEENVEYPYNGIFSDNKMQWNPHKCCNLDESQTRHAKRSQMQKTTCCMIPSTWNVQKRQLYRDREQISGFWGLRTVQAEMDHTIGGGNFWGDGKVLKLGCGDGCTTL